MTKNWFGKICLLGLIALIPVFGVIAVQGCLYGWARDAAWRMDNPFPDHVLGNEDGRLYQRGFFSMVIAIVVTAVVGACLLAFLGVLGFVSSCMASLMAQVLPVAHAGWSVLTVSSFFATILLVLAFFVVAFGAQFFVWVGSVRMSIYGTLSAGFQVARIWAMVRRAPAGLMKIALGQIGAFVVIGAGVAVLWCVVAFVIAFGSLLAAGAIDYPGAYGSAFDGFVAMSAIASVLLALVVVYVSTIACVTVQLFVCRSLGYWAADFDVASWRAQDEPMPFEDACGGVATHARR